MPFTTHVHVPDNSKTDSTLLSQFYFVYFNFILYTNTFWQVECLHIMTLAYV